MKYNKKMLFAGITHAVLILGGYIYTFSTQGEHLFLSILHYYSILCSAIAIIRWLFMYDALKPSADVFGVGFNKRTLPHYIEGQPNMNSIMVRFYVWLAVVLFGIVTL